MKQFMFFLLTVSILSCSAPEEPYFKKLKNVSFDSVSILNPLNISMQADAILHNPNALGANITGMNLELFVNGIKASDIEQDISARMSAKSDFTLPLKFKISLKDVLKDFKLSDLAKEKVLKYQLKGNLKVGVGTNLDVTLPINYEDQQELKL